MRAKNQKLHHLYNSTCIHIFHGPRRHCVAFARFQNSAHVHWVVGKFDRHHPFLELLEFTNRLEHVHVLILGFY
jgi:hypothetical protein